MSLPIEIVVEPPTQLLINQEVLPMLVAGFRTPKNLGLSDSLKATATLLDALGRPHAGLEGTTEVKQMYVTEAQMAAARGGGGAYGGTSSADKHWFFFEFDGLYVNTVGRFSIEVHVHKLVNGGEFEYLGANATRSFVVLATAPDPPGSMCVSSPSSLQHGARPANRDTYRAAFSEKQILRALDSHKENYGY